MKKKIDLKIKKILSNILKLKIEKITDNINVNNSKKWESLAHLNIVLALESEFKVSFDVEKVTKLTRLKLIKSSLKEKGIS